jgi:hypothetical protein
MDIAQGSGLMGQPVGWHFLLLFMQLFGKVLLLFLSLFFKWT